MGIWGSKQNKELAVPTAPVHPKIILKDEEYYRDVQERIERLEKKTHIPTTREYFARVAKVYPFLCIGIFGGHHWIRGDFSLCLMYAMTFGLCGMGWMADTILVFFQCAHYEWKIWRIARAIYSYAFVTMAVMFLFNVLKIKDTFIVFMTIWAALTLSRTIGFYISLWALAIILYSYTQKMKGLDVPNSRAGFVVSAVLLSYATGEDPWPTFRYQKHVENFIMIIAMCLSAATLAYLFYTRDYDTLMSYLDKINSDYIYEQSTLIWLK